MKNAHRWCSFTAQMKLKILPGTGAFGLSWITTDISCKICIRFFFLKKTFFGISNVGKKKRHGSCAYCEYKCGWTFLSQVFVFFFSSSKSFQKCFANTQSLNNCMPKVQHQLWQFSSKPFLLYNSQVP